MLLLTLVIVAFIFGTFIGSFLNVCVHRLPRNESVVNPPSRCYSCGTHLTWYDNLPIFGWLLLWGRCRWCGTAFSPRYVFAELGVGALTAASVWWVLVSGSPWIQVLPSPVAIGLAIGALLVLVWTLYVSSLIDLDHQIIPDEITKSFQLIAPFLSVAVGSSIAIEYPLPLQLLVQVDVFGAATYTPNNLLIWMLGIGGVALLALGLSVPLARRIYSSFAKQEEQWTEDDHRGFRLGVWWFMACTAFQLTVLSALLLITPSGWGLHFAWLLAQGILGSLMGWFSLYVIGFLGTIALRQNAMGFGDVKFLAPIGAFLGPIGTLYAFLGAAIIGTVVGLPYLCRKYCVLFRAFGRGRTQASRASQAFVRVAYRIGACLRRIPLIGSQLSVLRRHPKVPFGPYLAVGSLMALVGGGWLHHHLFDGLL